MLHSSAGNVQQDLQQALDIKTVRCFDSLASVRLLQEPLLPGNMPFGKYEQ